ncbi:DUF1028 domain-containing protein [Rathayibacter sp. VKM Ac-2803]|uniref:DUF1028 domain-containing protein n=1 Tax=unclassified Rathayibacter TaxID=2609250 RepID=UPI00135BB7C3|nr:MULTISPECIES: DUF1028 domain-containing protein [unclassified Rathayibacter]MWV48532.1 DUF1028 domain-containing protein [Rathayibacter sp. VKM Ac-2803]MWV60130.1 DUF1028 domain-containing protein [Rathayibacter sp. VKM Ac-2754]
MTVSLVARDPLTGALGMVVSSSSPAVAARCLHLRAGVGAVASQNVTNPALGTALLDALEAGVDSATALAAVLADEAFPQYRQLLLVDASGRTALHSGDRALGLHSAVQGSSAAAAGNLLAHDGVPGAMLSAFHASTGSTLEERLLDALRGAIEAGGEAGPVRSAGLAVVEDVPWRVTDLRVDDADDPVTELERLLGVWLPQKLDYRRRALDPEAAPSYGVPGDE